jgi:dTDP-4-dehydrorhamnose 3,5-epimerase
MKYTPSDVAGVTIIDIEPHRDDGGFFTRAFCANEFAAYGLISNVAQTNISYNYARGTLRGLHRQMPPYPQAKLVRSAPAAQLSTLPLTSAPSRTPTASTSW